MFRVVISVVQIQLRSMVRSFIDNGWCVQIRGPESGGRVGDLPVRVFDAGRGTEVKIPTEILIHAQIRRRKSLFRPPD